MGAFALHARHDPRETTRAARSKFLERFVREVDPEGILPRAERERRAAALRRLHFTRLALASAQARSARSARNRQHAAEVRP